MPFRETGSIKIFTFSLFDRKDLIQGIFTRHGGVSPVPWASLNLGGTLGDERSNVVENRKRIFETIGRPVDSIFDPWQVHGTEVLTIDEPRSLESPHQKADAILTNRGDITLFMRFADCVPIVLFDPAARVIGMVHAGWRGTVAGAAAVAVEKMENHYGCERENILAGIGPSISVEHYQVGEEVVLAARSMFKEKAGRVIWTKKGSYHFDLWQANQILLESAGVRTIEQSGICTYAHNVDWFSHRAENGKTGRFAAVLALN